MEQKIPKKTSSNKKLAPKNSLVILILSVDITTNFKEPLNDIRLSHDAGEHEGGAPHQGVALSVRYPYHAL